MKLTDLQKDKLRAFADDPAMFEAVIDQIIESMPPFMYRADMPNEYIGELIRAQNIAADYIRKGFKGIKTTYGTKDKKPVDKNNIAV